MEQFYQYLTTKGILVLETGIHALLFFIVGWYLVKFVTHLATKTMEKAKIEPTFISFSRSVLNTILKIIVIISTLGDLGFPTSSLFAIFGTAGAALALGFKDNLSNFVSGMIILFSKPFVVGDYIEIQSYAGTVKEIQMMYTVLSTIDNKIIMVPNLEMTSSIIVNNSHETKRRIELNFDVTYDQDIDQVKQVIMDVIHAHPKAWNEPQPLVRVNNYKDSSIEILLRVWCETEDYINLRFDLLEDIKKAFDQNHIEIPYNQLDVHIHQ